MATETFTIDAKHSIVEFAVKYMMVATVKGRFLDLEGKIQIDERLPSASSVTVTINAASVDTGVAERDNHLRSADFFNVKVFPEIRFHTTQIEKMDDRWKISGELTLRGITRPVVLEAVMEGRLTDNQGTERIGFSAETSLNRRDFGINWNGQMGRLLVADEVKISINLEAERRRASG